MIKGMGIVSFDFDLIFLNIAVFTKFKIEAHIALVFRRYKRISATAAADGHLESSI